MTIRRAAIALLLSTVPACADEGTQTSLAWTESSSAALDETTAPPPDDGSTSPPADGTGDDAPASTSSEGAPPADLPPENDCPRARVVVPPDEPLNVRPDPSTAGTPLGALANGALVDVLEQVMGESIEGNTIWFRIPYLGGDGYISATFAECTLDVPPEPPDGYYLPLPCGMAANCTQGNMGDISHNGLHAYAFDFGVPLDTTLVAMADGEVSLIYDATVPGDPCYDGGGPECSPAGNLVILRHGDGTTTLYKHLNAVHVAVGDIVLRGEPIGLSGTTGYSTGPHVHVMNMEDCGQLTCQSMPMEFVDAGVPTSGTPVVSQNCM